MHPKHGQGYPDSVGMVVWKAEMELMQFSGCGEPMPPRNSNLNQNKRATASYTVMSNLSRTILASNAAHVRIRSIVG